MMNNETLAFANLGTKATNLDLQIKLIQNDIRIAKTQDELYQLSCELINLVEEKTRCIYNIIELSSKYFLPTV